MQEARLASIPDYFYVKILDDEIRKDIFHRAAKDMGLNQTSLAKRLGLNEGRLKRWRQGVRFMPMKFLREVCILANIDLNYLEKKSDMGLKGDTYCRNYLPIKFPIRIDKEWAYFSQLINTDGHVTSNLKMIEIANDDIKVLKNLKKFLKGFGVSEESVYEKEWNKGKYFKICNRSFVRLFCLIFDVKPGKKYDVIKIPDVIKISPKSVIASALRGAFDGDGWVVKRTRRVGINSKSKQYMKDIHELLSIFNVNSYFRGPDKRGRYLCEITRYSNIKNFQKFIGFYNEKRMKGLEEIVFYLSKNPQYSISEAHEVILEKINKFEIIDTKKLSFLIERSEETTNRHLKELYCSGKINRNKVGKRFFYSLSNDIRGVTNEGIATTCG